ncbi:unnamed protein product [Triticum turgidum subsp. durum]|uniref:Uncharacterized protein n=1 Tax=Triticum turgidum subsp. durum TaxID=4567 RepID=A0A9R0R7F4_TRITD|nr:unnamed protein product [Triticum turgidum subsp. durum]
MCAHAGMIVTRRGQRITMFCMMRSASVGMSSRSLCTRSPMCMWTAYISYAAPIAYAHLAAAQVGTFMKFEDMSDTSSSQGGGHTSAGSAPVPELPRLHEKVRSSMFFC